MLTALEFHHAYAPQCFSGQKHELELIEKKIQEARRGILLHSVNYFWGIGGMGKSWLLSHLHQLYRFDPTRSAASSPETEKPALTLSASLTGTNKSFSWPVLVKQLAADLLAQLAGLAGGTGEADGERVKAIQAGLQAAAATREGEKLINALRRMTQDWVPVLLLDEVDRLAAEDWSLVERQLIEPLAVSGRVVIVVAGRRANLRWQRFEARRRVANHSLQPFDLRLARQLVAQADPSYSPRPIVETFFAYTAGIPAVIRMMADAAALWDHHAIEPPQRFGVSVLENGRHEALLQLVAKAEDVILADVPAHLRDLLHHVIPLRFYRLGSLRTMVEECSETLSPAPDNYYLQILRELEQTGVIWWERTLRAYVTSLPLRRLLTCRQWLTDQGKTAYSLNHSAIDMYWRWAKDNPQSCENAICEIWYHLGVVAKGGEGVYGRRRSGWLKQRATAALTFARDHLTPSQLYGLHNHLAADQELRQLLPPQLHRELLTQLARAVPRNDMTNVLAYI